MSKSRGNFLDPADFVAAFGSDGARYVALREVPFDRDAEVSWDSFVRRYNADLANDFGNLVNRTVSMTNRYLDGERPAPRPPPRRRSPRAGRDTLARVRERLDACLLHDALAELWEFVGGANKTVDAERPWDLAKAAKAGDDAAADAPRGRAGRPPRDVPPRRAGGDAVHARDRRRASWPSSGYAYPVRRGRQRRSAAARRARLGCPRRRGRPGHRAGAAVPAPRPRGRPRLTAATARPARASLGPRASSTATATSTPTASRATPTSSSAARGSPAWSGSSSRAGTSPRASARSRLLDRFAWLDVGVGVHPHDAAKVDDAGWATIVGMAADARVVAIGETGLDYDRVFSPSRTS